MNIDERQGNADWLKSGRCRVCGEAIPEARVNLGYDTCLKHGEQKRQFTVAPAFNKGPLQLITRTCVKDIGKK